jgi:hypothetical protein
LERRREIPQSTAFGPGPIRDGYSRHHHPPRSRPHRRSHCRTMSPSCSTTTSLFTIERTGAR